MNRFQININHPFYQGYLYRDHTDPKVIFHMIPDVVRDFNLTQGLKYQLLVNGITDVDGKHSLFLNARHGFLVVEKKGTENDFFHQDLVTADECQFTEFSPLYINTGSKVYQDFLYHSLFCLRGEAPQVTMELISYIPDIITGIPFSIGAKTELLQRKRLILKNRSELRINLEQGELFYHWPDGKVTPVYRQECIYHFEKRYPTPTMLVNDNSAE